MTLSRVKQRRPILTLLSLMVVSLVGLLLLPPIPQDQSYHQFADQRILLGVPNFWNVVSNVPFIAIGAAGLWRFHHSSAIIVLFLGYFLLASARPTIIGIRTIAPWFGIGCR